MRNTNTSTVKHPSRFYALMLLMLWVFVACAPPSDADATASSAALVNTNQRSNGLQHTQIIEARDNVESLKAVLDISYEDVQINSLAANASALLEADIEHLHALDYRFTRENAADFHLAQKVALEDLPQTPQWALALHPAVALNLALNVNAGRVHLNMPSSGLTHLESRINSGQVRGTVPTGPFTGNLSVQSGSSDLSLPAGANVTWQAVSVQSGTATFRIHHTAVASFIDVQVQSGTVIIELDKETPFWLDVEAVGAGMVEIAYPLRQIRHGERAGEGTWESATYHADRPGVIVRVSQIESGTLMVQ